MDDLKRDLTPLSKLAWTELEEEARQTLKRALAARKLVDFTGPLGWSGVIVKSGVWRSGRFPV